MIPSLPLVLLALLPSAAVAGKDFATTTTTKTFRFKEDTYVELGQLPTAMGPNQSVDLLLASLNGDFVEIFKDAWIDGIQSDLQQAECTVLEFGDPEFTICDWKYPDRYDVDELPTPGQCYKHENYFVQRIYYNIEELEIHCPQNFSYDDLDKEAWTRKAFSGDNFLNIINPPGEDCDGDSNSVCLFDDADTADWSPGYDACNAELYVNRFTDIPVYLKCLNQGYGRRIANKIIKALDKYLEMDVFPVVAEEVLLVTPESFVYNFASPYDSDRMFCSHGAYYVQGNLVNQLPDADGTYITKFFIGFDMIWFKDRDFGVDDLPDIEEVVNRAFRDGDFLDFLENEYPNYDGFVQDSCECNVIDPGDTDVTFAPTGPPTYVPTAGPVCDLDTDEGCEGGKVCRLSCVYDSDEPMCFDDGEERDCGNEYGPGYVCFDSDGDGVITPDDHSSGCQYMPPTGSPTPVPTEYPTTLEPTESPITPFPTLPPTIRPVTPSPTVSDPPSEFIDPTASPSLTPVPSGAPTPIPSTLEPTVDPTLGPTAPPTYGSTDTVDTSKTLAPTPLLTRPVMTLPPTTPPIDMPSTPSPTCPLCIVHPDDTDEDECPIVNTGTCGDGDRGDGICPYDGHCCSKWGWCGTTAAYCDSAPAPTPSGDGAAPVSPTYSVDAGQCAGGEVGDGFCTEGCCSPWGYCGTGETYCATTRILDDNGGYDGTCGGGGVGDGACKYAPCCSEFGFCGETELYCTGWNGLNSSDTDDGQQVIDDSPLPDDLKPEFGYRCGVTELDARGNCKSECTHHSQCPEDEECWGVQLNYCDAFEDEEHPVCTDLDRADDDSRCGYDEASARGFCGLKCEGDDECGEGERCFPTILNLCECHTDTCPEEAEIVFARAKALIGPYFVETDPENNVEGKPRSASSAPGPGLAAALLAFLSSMKFAKMA